MQSSYWTACNISTQPHGYFRINCPLKLRIPFDPKLCSTDILGSGSHYISDRFYHMVEIMEVIFVWDKKKDKKSKQSWNKGKEKPKFENWLEIFGH